MEKLKPKISVSILPIIGGALLGISKDNSKPKIMRVPKEISWEQRRNMRRIRKTGK